MYHVELFAEREEWDAFLQQAQPKSFLHAWQWGALHEALGSRIFRLGLYRNSSLVAIALCIKTVARRGTFLLCPHGPIVAESALASVDGVLSALLDYLKPLARSEGCHYIRVAPLLPATHEYNRLFTALGFREAPTHIHPERAWIVDLAPSEEELLGAMRKSTRYDIKKANRDGVLVSRSTNPDDLETFWSIYAETVKRQQFTPFSKRYLRAEFEVFTAEQNAELFFAHYHDKPVSAAIVVTVGESAYYHHGASLQAYARIPAAHAVQWEAMRGAKRAGCRYYNFWGVAPPDKKSHPWAGLSFFKQGFGGFAEDYVHAKDFVLSQKYWMSFSIDTVRRIKRRL